VELIVGRCGDKLILYMERIVGVDDGAIWTIGIKTVLLNALELHSDVALRNFVATFTIPYSIARVGLCLKSIVVSLHCIDGLAVWGVVVALVFLLGHAMAILR